MNDYAHLKLHQARVRRAIRSTWGPSGAADHDRPLLRRSLLASLGSSGSPVPDDAPLPRPEAARAR